MTGRIQALVRTLGGEMDQEELLVMLCQAAEMELAGRLRPGLTPGCWVEWNGTGYEVQTAHPIQAGGRTSHVWAVLRPRDREAGA